MPARSSLCQYDPDDLLVESFGPQDLCIYKIQARFAPLLYEHDPIILSQLLDGLRIVDDISDELDLVIRVSGQLLGNGAGAC